MEVGREGGREGEREGGINEMVEQLLYKKQFSLLSNIGQSLTYFSNQYISS